MSRLFFIELRRLIRPFALLYFLFIVLLYQLDFWFYLACMPAFSVAISNQTLKRSSWYLNLPWARAQLMLMVFLQNLIIFVANLVFTAGIFVLEGKVFFGEKWDTLVILAMFGNLIGFIFFSMRSLAGIAIRKQSNLTDMIGSKWVVRFVGVVLFILCVWLLNLFEEPVFFVLGIISLLYLIVVLYCTEFVLPDSTRRIVTKVTGSMGAILFVSTIVSAISFANLGGVKKVASSICLSYLGRFPSFISDQRAVELFVGSDIGSNPSMLRHLKALKENVTFDLWQKRTAACTDSDCLNLSADAVELEKLSQQEIEQRFLAIMNLCKFSIGRYGNARCSGGKLSEERLKDWLGLLEKQGALSQWLLSEDPLKQIIAIKGLPFDVSEEQKRNIEILSGSPDPLVKTTAALFLANLSDYKRLAIDCQSEKNEDHAACRAKERHYEM